MKPQTVYSQPVIDMLTVSAEYCVMLEKQTSGALTRHQFLEQITKVLPLLYVKAALLPAVEAQDDDFLPEVVTEEDYEEVRQAVWRLLKADDEYLEVFTPDMAYSEGAMTRTVSEDLADIYQDLKNFVAVYAERNEDAMLAALATVSENFRTYWGQRLVNVLRPLHDLLYNHTEELNEDTEQQDADTTF